MRALKLQRTIITVAAMILLSAAWARAQARTPAANASESTCITCHLALGNDFAKPVILTRNDVHAKQGVTCQDCHKGDPSELDPERSMDPLKGFVGKPSTVCGTCHVRQVELFDAGAHKAGFDALGVPACVTCHGNHGVLHPYDAMTGVGRNSFCSKCHGKGEPGYETAERMHQRLSALDSAIGNAHLTLDRASRAGMEVSAARFQLSDAKERLIDSRVVVHSFSLKDLGEAIDPGMALARKAEQAGQDALAELQFRRKGLAVSLLVIALAVVSVYLRIREIERPGSRLSRLEDQ